MKRRIARTPSARRAKANSQRVLLALVDWLLVHGDRGGLQIIVDECLGLEGRAGQAWGDGAVAKLFNCIATLAPRVQVDHMVEVARRCQVTIQEIEARDLTALRR